MKKRRLFIFGRLSRMDDNRLTKLIFKYLWGKKSTSSWIKKVKKDLEKNNINAEEAIEREVFREKCKKWKESRVGERKTQVQSGLKTGRKDTVKR